MGMAEVYTEMSDIVENPRLSVIMSVYNIEKLEIFDQAMQSVLNQTMRDYEFIICDDGSTDATDSCLRHWAGRDSRIRLLKNYRNEGLASALNRCIEAARGDFIARQDADDISLYRRFELQLKFLEKYLDIAFVGSNVILFNKNGDWGERFFPLFPGPRDFLFTMPFVHGALLFRKQSLLDARGYRVAKETRRAEDYDMLMRLYAMGMRGANIQQPLYRFLEDMNAMNRRKYRYRIDEAKVRFLGFRALGLFPGGFPYVVKPLIVGLIPARGLKKLKMIVGRKF